MEAKLVVLSGKTNKREISLRLPTTIGRSRDAGLTVAHPMISRQHCQISESGGLLKLQDLGSLNGTIVGNQRVTEAYLRPGDEFRVGPVTFRVLYEADEGVPTAPPTMTAPDAGELAESPDFAPAAGSPEVAPPSEVPDFAPADEAPVAEDRLSSDASVSDDAASAPPAADDQLDMWDEIAAEAVSEDFDDAQPPVSAPASAAVAGPVSAPEADSPVPPSSLGPPADSDVEAMAAAPISKSADADDLDLLDFPASDVEFDEDDQSPTATADGPTPPSSTPMSEPLSATSPEAGEEQVDFLGDDTPPSDPRSESPWEGSPGTDEDEPAVRDETSVASETPLGAADEDVEPGDERAEEPMSPKKRRWFWPFGGRGKKQPSPASETPAPEESVTPEAAEAVPESAQPVEQPVAEELAVPVERPAGIEPRPAEPEEATAAVDVGVSIPAEKPQASPAPADDDDALGAFLRGLK